MLASVAGSIRGIGCVGVRDKSLPLRIPNPHTRIQTPRRNPLPIKRNRIDLAEMSMQDLKTLALAYTPYACLGIIGSGGNQITVDFEAPDGGLVANEDLFADSGPHVPDAEGGVPGAGDGGVGVGHAEAADGGAVAAEGVDALAGGGVSVCLYYSIA